MKPCNDWRFKPRDHDQLIEGACKHRLELFGARTGTLEFPRVIFLRKLSFWAPESADSGQSADPESEL